MSDELDEVHRYVNGIDPPDARTMAEVRGRLSSTMAASGLSSARPGRTRRVHAVRWALALFVVLAVGVALLVPTLGHRTPSHGSGAHCTGSPGSARCRRSSTPPWPRAATT